MTWDLVTGWQFWAGLALMALILEFAIGGIGFLAILAGAAALTAVVIGITTSIFGGILSWVQAVIIFAVCIVIAILATKLFWRRRRSGPDVNEY